MCFGTSFWMLFGYLEEHFGGLEGSWEQVRIWMDSGALPGTTPGAGNWGSEGLIFTQGPNW